VGEIFAMTKRLREPRAGCPNLPDELWQLIFAVHRTWSPARCICRRWDHMIRGQVTPNTIYWRHLHAQNRQLAEGCYVPLDLATASKAEVTRRLDGVPGCAPALVCQLAELSGAPATFELCFRVTMYMTERQFLRKLSTHSIGESHATMRFLFLAVTGPGLVELWSYDLYKSHVKRSGDDRRSVMCTTQMHKVRYTASGARLKTKPVGDVEIGAGVRVVVRDTPFAGELNEHTENAVFVRCGKMNAQQLCKTMNRIHAYNQVRGSAKEWLVSYAEELLGLRDCVK
jgi:hypothetical protein